MVEYTYKFESNSHSYLLLTGIRENRAIWEYTNGSKKEKFQHLMRPGFKAVISSVNNSTSVYKVFSKESQLQIIEFATGNKPALWGSTEKPKIIVENFYGGLDDATKLRKFIPAHDFARLSGQPITAA